MGIISSLSKLLMLQKKLDTERDEELQSSKLEQEYDESTRALVKMHTDYYERITKSLFGCDEDDDARVINDHCSQHDTCPKRCTRNCVADNRKYNGRLRDDREKFMAEHFKDKYCKYGREFLREDGYCSQFLVSKCQHADSKDCLVRQKFGITIPTFEEVVNDVPKEAD